jgi:nicotinate-nucleotide adenylyltransferase
MKIALFGGSFNPPHTGHGAMVRRLAKRKSIDQVWIVPTWKHPFEKFLTPFSLRFTLCRLAFGDLSPKVKIQPIERQLGGTSYTVKTLRALQKKHPQNTFFLVLGADAQRQLSTWKEGDKLKEMIDCIVFPRGAQSSIPAISSTDLRKKLARGLIPQTGLPRRVAHFLRQHKDTQEIFKRAVTKSSAVCTK